MDEPTVAALLAEETRAAAPDRSLAAHYAPVLRFDRHEPFFPSLAGYTVFRADAPSPSFPRTVALCPAGQPPAMLAIEYAIWWDWDIEHLYELEHVWVFVGEEGRVVHVDASYHGKYHQMPLGQGIALDGDHPVLYSEPGKHAFFATLEAARAERERTLERCRQTNMAGVHVTPLFRGIIGDKSPQADALVNRYLRALAFTPTFDFAQEFRITEAHLVAWPLLFAWIPRRVTWWVEQLRASVDQP